MNHNLTFDTLVGGWQLMLGELPFDVLIFYAVDVDIWHLMSSSFFFLITLETRVE